MKIRHGDVLVIPAKCGQKFPKACDEPITLAEGEVTGHSHRIVEGLAALIKYDEKVYLKVTSAYATLTHQEHKEVRVPQGEYEIVIQREYSPDGWRAVRD